MPRPPRENLEDGIYHVFARGNDKADIYRDDLDRRLYLRFLGRVVVRRRWDCLAYCLMTNHLHLLIQTPDANLSLGMQQLHGVYAQVFNARHDRNGHLFQGRYGAVRVTSDRQLSAATAYIAHNPVSAGLCKTPEAWPWSSHTAITGAPAPPWLATDRLLSHFGHSDETAREQYKTLIQTPTAYDPPDLSDHH